MSSSRLRADVEALAGIVRDSAGPGERAAAEWGADRLRDLGAEDVRIESFSYQDTFAYAQGAHFAAAALAALRERRLVAAATLASFELDYSGRSQWTRGLLPAGEGANAVGRLSARGQRTSTLVLVAHHDAAHTGLMWDPRFLEAGDAAAARSGRRASLALLPELAMLGAVFGGRRIRRLSAAILAAAVALTADQARSPTVPGANDNASGVAGVLAVAELLALDRPPGLEVIVLLCGCEESGMGGMDAWMRAEGRQLDSATTLVAGLDTVGSGEPVVATAEGGVWPVRYREEDVALAERAAGAAGVQLRRWRLGGWTDPVLARLGGLPALSLLSVREGGFPNYHLPTDTPDHVDYVCVEACVRAVLAIARAHAR
ncbi:MAG TPA: M28 family peptidase [Thermoleophilaceae bacterium]|nr:M28 family peptidase [Thermoleophilaceae bacterium]